MAPDKNTRVNATLSIYEYKPFLLYLLLFGDDHLHDRTF